MIGKRLSAARDIVCVGISLSDQKLRCRQRLLLALFGQASVDSKRLLSEAKWSFGSRARSDEIVSAGE